MVSIKEIVFDRIMWLSVIFIAVLGLCDYIIMQVFYNVGYDMHSYYVLGFWIMAYTAIASFAIIYYLFTKNHFRSLLVFLAPMFMVLGGLEDFFFFVVRWVLTGIPIDSQMCWFNYPVALVSKLLNESCVTPISLFANVILFFGVAYLIAIVLKRYE